MMRNLMAMLVCGACALAQAPAEVRLQADIEGLVAFGGRTWGSDSGLEASTWLAERFTEIGLEPGGKDGFFQPLPDKGRNVVAWLAPTVASDSWVLLGAHFDHLGHDDKGVYLGADDNASGVAAMLECALRLSQQTERKRGILFVGFDAEEFGLAGSRYFARTPTRPLSGCAAMLCLDILGRSMLDAMPGTLFAFGGEWSSGLRAQVDASATALDAQVLQLAAEYVGPRSDFLGFALEQVPFAFLTSGTHADYHTVDDLPEHIDYGSLAGHTELISHLLAGLLAGERPAFEGHEPDAHQEARNIALIAHELLAHAEGLGRFERSQLRALERLGERNAAAERLGSLARSRMVVQTQLTLLSTGSLTGMRERLQRVLDGL